MPIQSDAGASNADEASEGSECGIAAGLTPFRRDVAREPHLRGPTRSDPQQRDQLFAVQPREILMHSRDQGVRCATREDGLIVHPTLDHGRVRKQVHPLTAGPGMLRSYFVKGLTGKDAPRSLRRRLALPQALPYRIRMGDLDRLVPSGIIEQWVYHLRRQRSRATDAIWLIDQGFTLHDGQEGVPQHDATARWRAEQETVVAEVTALLALYDGINLGKVDIDTV